MRLLLSWAIASASIGTSLTLPCRHRAQPGNQRLELVVERPALAAPQATDLDHRTPCGGWLVRRPHPDPSPSYRERQHQAGQRGQRTGQRETLAGVVGNLEVGPLRVTVERDRAEPVGQPLPLAWPQRKRQ